MLHCDSHSRLILGRMRATLRAAAGAARQARGLFSVTFATPDLPFHGLPEGVNDYAYWAQPARGVCLLGLGTARVWTGAGRERFRGADRFWSELKHNWAHADPDRTGLEPLALAGFSFDPGDWDGGLPNIELRVPALLLARRGDVCGLCFTWNKGAPDDERIEAAMARAEGLLAAVRLGAQAAQPNALERIDAAPADAAWLVAVGHAVRDIRAGNLDKVVLARRVRFRCERALDPARVMAACRERYPGCVHFAYSHGDGVLMGASPERLVALRGRQVESDAIAGTVGRDAHPERDERLGIRLRTSGKLRREHEPVVAAIARMLLPACETLQVPEQPCILKLLNAQHLWSPIQGRVRPEVTLFDLAGRLHPTPAVGGAPRHKALGWLAIHGEERKNWYSGGIGWIGLSGDGEFAVVLRSAWLQGREAELHAGAGIVAESDPQAELAETELKLGAMFEVLEAAADSHLGRERQRG